jgi:astacin (peptidase family M12A)
MVTSKKKHSAKGGAKSKKKRAKAPSKKPDKQQNYEDPALRSTTKPRPGIIALGKGGGTLKSVRYSAINGKAIFEGDICLGSVKELEATVKGDKLNVDEIPVSGASVREVGIDKLAAAGIVMSDAPSGEEAVIVVGPQFRWPNGVVPYVIDPNLPNPSRVTDAIKHWEKKTKIRFVKRTATHPDYVSFEAQDGCFSQVGRRGGKQVISLGEGCQVGQAIHEIGHAVGLWHEQSREDRSRFIRIVWQNIQAGKEHNFDQHIVDGDDVGKYDYGSIMHYPATAFTKNGLPTIIPLKLGGGSIGQRKGLSRGDIKAVKFMYS